MVANPRLRLLHSILQMTPVMRTSRSPSKLPPLTAPLSGTFSVGMPLASSVARTSRSNRDPFSLLRLGMVQATDDVMVGAPRAIERRLSADDGVGAVRVADDPPALELFCVAQAHVERRILPR